MKEQTLLEMKNKVESLTRLMQYLLNETTHLKELSVGSLETLKLMPGYEQAIEQIKEKVAEEPSGGTSSDTDGKTSE